MKARLGTLPVSIVIPVCGESLELDAVLAALMLLKPSAAEVVFVDTSRNSELSSRIDTWLSKLEFEVVLIRYPGAYPGAARNLGIKAASRDWIAFLDAGIEPQADWIGALWRCAILSRAEAVYGFCTFRSDAKLGQILCAISYGINRCVPVLPASIFNRKIFKEVGMFEEGIRAGEDILFQKNLSKLNVRVSHCQTAKVIYRHFSADIFLAMKKQYVYEQNITVTKTSSPFRLVILVVHFAIYPCIVLIPSYGLIALCLYHVIRSVLDPIRRSGYWWSSPSQVFWTPFVVAALDLAAVTGRVTALLGLSPFKRQAPPVLGERC